MCCCVSEPDIPTMITIISDIEQTSVRLSWQPGDSQVINRTSVMYLDQKSSANNSWQRQVVRTSSPSSSDEADRQRRSADEYQVHVLTGLEPGTTYIIRIEVQSFDKFQYSPNITCETREFCWFLYHFCTFLPSPVPSFKPASLPLDRLILAEISKQNIYLLRS